MRMPLFIALSGVSLALVAEQIDLRTDYASCSIETEGARVLSFKGPDGAEALWNAEPAQKDDPKWAHGGIPICWPWFGVNGRIDVHGTAWRRPFAVVSRTDGKDRAVLVLARDEGDIRLEYTLTLRDTLKLELRTINRGTSDFTFSAAFHPYFRVGERDRCEVGGVKREPIPMTRAIDDVFAKQPGSCSIYRLHDHALDRTIFLFFENSTGVNIWNPGAEKNCPGTIPGDEWRRFVAVEPMLGEAAQPVTLKAGDAVSLMMGVDVRKGSKTCGYVGRDPRRPAAASEPTGRPFHVLYLGAHPDDCDYDYGAAVAQLVKSGAKVTAVTFCNGCKGHVEMEPEALAARRLKEAQAAAKVYGLERYVVSECPDCELDASRFWRERMGRLIRNLAPDMVLTHRPVDYHADHRAVGQVSQDLAYFLGVPHWCPDTPVPEKLPFFLYTVDGFTVPRRLRPDLVINCEPMLETAACAISCHASQLFEWMPPQDGVDPKTLSTPEIRWNYIRKHVRDYYLEFTGRYPDLVERLYGRRDVPVTVAELSEYSREPAQCEIDYLETIPGFRWTKDVEDRIELKSSTASAVVALDGARILSYVADGREVLWQPKAWRLTGKDWAHGGMPVCWPWFGSAGPNPDVKHGFAWRHRFAVRAREASRVVLGWTAPQGAGADFPYGFDLEVEVALAQTLRVEVRTKNIGAEPFAFTVGAHPYFSVGDRDRTSVTRMDGLPFCDTRVSFDFASAWRGDLCVTSAYDHAFAEATGTPRHELVDPSFGRRIGISSVGATKLVVWNPGPGAHDPADPAPGGLACGDWRRFACVEPVIAWKENAIRLAPGKTHVYSIDLASARTFLAGSTTTRYARQESPPRP